MISSTVTRMHTELETPKLAQLRLMQLISPSLPIGGFTYSQGIEWAVEATWINKREQLEQWLSELALSNLARTDLAVLIRMFDAVGKRDVSQLKFWSATLIACRETSELRQEERNRGRALAGLLTSLGLLENALEKQTVQQTHLAGIAWAAAHWDIAKSDLLVGYAWSWLENLTLAAIKAIPLGQTDGQLVLRNLGEQLLQAVDVAHSLNDEDIGASAPGAAIASSQHQFQYTRLFRS